MSCAGPNDPPGGRQDAWVWNVVGSTQTATAVPSGVAATHGPKCRSKVLATTNSPPGSRMASPAREDSSDAYPMIASPEAVTASPLTPRLPDPKTCSEPTGPVLDTAA